MVIDLRDGAAGPMRFSGWEWWVASYGAIFPARLSRLIFPFDSMKILSSVLVLFLVLISNNGLCQTYQLTDLGVWVGTNSYAQGVNNQSQVIGYWNVSGSAHAILYQAGAVTDLGLLGLSGTNNYALSINNLGEVVGFSEISNDSSAFLYQNGAATNIGNWNGLNSSAYGISDDGYIAGRIETLEGAQAALSTTVVSQIWGPWEEQTAWRSG